MPNDTTSETTHLRRRSLVRAGATAAWTVPVIAMAAPAHAASCSGGLTTLTAVTLDGTQSQSGKPKLTVTLQVQVCNTGSSQTCALAATATTQDASGKLDTLTVGSWPGASAGGGSTSLTVLAPADQQLDAGQCATYQVSYQLHDGSGTHTVMITFRTDNGATSSVSVTTTA